MRGARPGRSARRWAGRAARAPRKGRQPWPRAVPCPAPVPLLSELAESLVGVGFGVALPLPFPCISRGLEAPAGSVRDQALSSELILGFGEADVAGREDHVGLHQLVVAELLAVGRHQLEHLAPELSEPGLVALLHRAHRSVVELVEPVRVGIGQLELPLPGYADYHWDWPSSSAGLSPPPPEPSSAFILASSSSTCWPAPSDASSRSMSSWP